MRIEIVIYIYGIETKVVSKIMFSFLTSWFSLNSFNTLVSVESLREHKSNLDIRVSRKCRSWKSVYGNAFIMWCRIKVQI